MLKDRTAMIEELKTYTKSELIREIILLNDEVNGIWKTKERYKKMLKDSGVWKTQPGGNYTIADNLKKRIDRLQARLDYYEQPTDINEVNLGATN